MTNPAPTDRFMAAVTAKSQTDEIARLDKTVVEGSATLSRTVTERTAVLHKADGTITELFRSKEG